MKRRLGRLAVLIVLLLTLLGIGGRASLAIYHVEGNSMTPAISPGERVLVNQIAYRWSDPEVGDLVIAGEDNALPGFVVKRVVAVGGQHVAFANGRVWIDGRELVESYLPPGTTTDCDGTGCDLIVPTGSVFLLGDNRSESFDSRVVGAVPLSSIAGKVIRDL